MKPPNNRYIILGCVAFGLVSLIYALVCLWPEAKFSSSTSVSNDGQLQQSRPIQLSGRRFDIPLKYIDGTPKQGLNQGSILLEVVWPEMIATSDIANKHEYLRILHEERRLGWLLLEAASDRPSPDKQIELLEQHLTKSEAAGFYEGLEKNRWFHGRSEAPSLWAEVYLDRDSSGKIVSFIQCRHGEGVRSPICQDKFIDSGLLYQISYHETPFLSEWRKQRERATTFINNLEISP